MKKLLSIILILSVMCISSVSFAEEQQINGLHEKLNNVLMEKSFTQNEIEEMDKLYITNYEDWFWNDFLPATKSIGKTKRDNDQDEYEYWLDLARVDYSQGIRISFLNTSKYAVQYSDLKKFNYLFAGQEYWSVPSIKSSGERAKFDKNGYLITDISKRFGIDYSGISYTKETIDFLKDEDNIKKMLVEKEEKKVDDIKIFSIWHGITLLYIRCGENEYLVKLYDMTDTGKRNMPNVELFKLYSASDIMTNLSDKSEDIYTYRQNLIYAIELIKPTYDAEAQALQNAGLLLGNENGLDLLKPLTRIEAATIILRAIGEGDFKGIYEEEIFTDVPVSHWGYKAAAKAYDLGLIQGVGDNQFAPEKPITAAEFSTMVLRAAHITGFDWQDSLDILTERGIISEESAETMDFFTRGDMAKIIYEARVNELF